MFYAWILSKAIDSGCMHKKIIAKKVTLGDWIINDIIVNRKTKHLLIDSQRDYFLQTEHRISLSNFEKLLTKKYIKFSGNSLKTRFSSKLFKEKLKIIKHLVGTTSKTNLLKQAKKFKFDKNQTDEFFKFLESENIYFGKQYVCGFNTTGATQEQVNLINELYKKKKIKYITVKEGIPFVPSFFFGLILYGFLGFWWLFLV